MLGISARVVFVDLLKRVLDDALDAPGLAMEMAEIAEPSHPGPALAGRGFRRAVEAPRRATSALACRLHCLHYALARRRPQHSWIIRGG